MTSWFKAKLGRIRISTAVLVIVFIGLLWVHESFEPEPAATETPAPAVVPPGFVPDPNYTWVPRTNVRRPTETSVTTTPPTTTTTDTTTTSPTSPTESTPTPTESTTPSTTPTTTDGAEPGPPPATPAPPG